jgi:hypothetical protein
MKESVCRRAILVGVSIVSVTYFGTMAQADLPQAKVCSADDGGWSVPGGVASTGEIVMDNDGGWCGQRLGVKYNQTIFGGAMHLSRRPAHGRVSITETAMAPTCTISRIPAILGQMPLACWLSFTKSTSPTKSR